jgi:beta-lactamase regulating signal transducer with metallopeptidase domain
MSAALGWLATFLVHSTLWISGAWLVARRIDSAAWRERLWRGSIAGGLLTSVLVMALPTASVGWRWEMPASSVATGETDGAVPEPSPSAPGVLESVALDSPAAPVANDARPTPVPQPAHESEWSWSTIQVVLLAVWLAGAALSLAHLAWAHARLARALRTRREVESGALTDCLARLATRTGFPKPPRISTSTSLPAPVALARGEIVVPERALARLGPAELETLLGHELAHLARCDPWWLLALNVLRRALWVQPMLSLATSRAVKAAEMRCDELAARWTSGELALARCLAEVATWIEGRPASRLVAGMAEQPSALVERVERLLSPRRPSRAQGAWVATWLIGMLSALACAGPEVEPPEAEATTSASSDAAEELGLEPAGSLRQLGYSEQREALRETVAAYLASQQGSAARNEGLESAIRDINARIGTSMHVSVTEQDGLPFVTIAPHVIHVRADGSIDCSMTQLVAAGSSDDKALGEHLKSIAAERSPAPAVPDAFFVPSVPDEALSIKAEDNASHALLHRVLHRCAAPDVQIVSFELAVGHGAPLPFTTVRDTSSAPDAILVSIHSGRPLPDGSIPSLSYVFERRRSTQFTVRGFVATGPNGLDSVESRLREAFAESPDLPILIDAVPEARCSDIVALCELARRIGFQHIRIAVGPEER